jgi:hypothetical protein
LLTTIIGYKFAAMKILRNFTLIFYLIFFFNYCTQRSLEPQQKSDRLVPQYGTDTSFDIATWNIETFPLDGINTIRSLSKIIHDMDIDLIGVQEINSVSAFNQMLDSLPAYDCVISALPDDMLKLGIIYKRSFISVSPPFQIFTNDSYAFPRPPLVSYIQVKHLGITVFDFT